MNTETEALARAPSHLAAATAPLRVPALSGLDLGVGGSAAA